MVKSFGLATKEEGSKYLEDLEVNEFK